VDAAEAPPVVDQPRAGFRRLARDSAIYASGSVAGKAIGLLLLPVVTRVLGPADFGRLDVLSTLQSAATSILLLGLDTGATRLYPDLDEDGRRAMFGSWLRLTAMVVVPLTLALALFRTPVSEALFDSPAYGGAVAFTALAILGATVQLVALTILRNHGRAPAYAVVSAGSLAVNGVLVVTLLALGHGVTAVLGAMAASMTLGGIVGLLVAGRSSIGRADPALRRRLLALGLPLLPAMAATWVAEFANRAILLRASGPVEVGYFSVAARFASVALLVVVGFQTAWQPRAFADGADEPAALQRIADDGRRILAAVALAVVGLAVASPELVRLAAGERFDAALPAVGLSLVFALGLAAYHVVTMPSALSRRMRDLSVAAAVAAGVGIVLNLWWAPMGGSGATAAAVAVGQFAGVGVGIALARHQAPVPYAWGPMAAITAAAAAAALLATLPDGGAPLLLRVVVATVVGLLVLGAPSTRPALRRG
jgi:O-antigen/teichoic acid export membrane protein